MQKEPKAQIFMNKKFLWSCIVGGVLCGFASCTSTPTNNPADVNIIPLPNEIQLAHGHFSLKEGMTISFSDKGIQSAAEYLTSLLTRSTGFVLNTEESDQGNIRLILTQEAEEKEGSYTVYVKADYVEIAAASYGGIISGIETVRQLLSPDIESTESIQGKTWTIPAVNIKDAPRFEWRGLMLDVSRHFYTKEEVKELLDLMALYKMNKFHWHLTDDQGWRVEIKKYPDLTEKGAWRAFNAQDRECMRRAIAENNPDYQIPEEKLRIIQGDTLYGGYYTQEDIKEVVQYASVRGIDIIPEIDMPGHMLAAVGNYSGVSCFSTTGWGKTFSSPVCPGKESALEFCKNVYAEIIPLFPYKYVHIGGDEVEKSNWKKCPDCQKRIKDNGLKDEEELQAWFIHYMEHYFNEQGKELIGWDEIIEGGLSETATVMWWRNWNPQAIPTATAHGNPVIYCPNACFYLDYQQDRSSVKSIYEYTLAPDSLGKKQQDLVLGVQGNIWTEWIPSRERMQYMVVPRMMAIAEKGWSQPDQMVWEEFQERMVGQFPRLSVMNVNYRIPDLEGFHTTNAFIGKTEVSVVSPDPSCEIHYTTDGTAPTLESPQYEGAITIDTTTYFTFRSFRSNGKEGDIFQTAYLKQEYSKADQQASPENNGLKATWHECRVDSCSQIDQFPVKGTYEINDVTIPAEVKGDIGLIINGYFNAPKNGIYTFYLLSDDGSYLKIDNETVVDNDGPHAPVEIVGQRALSKGLHPIETRYFDYNGGTLSLRIYNPDGQLLPVESGIYAY